MKKLIGSLAAVAIALTVACGSAGGPQDPQTEGTQAPAVHEGKVETQALSHDCWYVDQNHSQQQGWCCDWSGPPFNRNTCTTCIPKGTPCP